MVTRFRLHSVQHIVDGTSIIHNVNTPADNTHWNTVWKDTSCEVTQVTTTPTCNVYMMKPKIGTELFLATWVADDTHWDGITYKVESVSGSIPAHTIVLNTLDDLWAWCKESPNDIIIKFDDGRPYLLIYDDYLE